MEILRRKLSVLEWSFTYHSIRDLFGKHQKIYGGKLLTFFAVALLHHGILNNIKVHDIGDKIRETIQISRRTESVRH